MRVENLALKDLIKSKDLSSEILQTDAPLIVKPLSGKQFNNDFDPRENLKKVFERHLTPLDFLSASGTGRMNTTGEED